MSHIVRQNDNSRDMNSSLFCDVKTKCKNVGNASERKCKYNRASETLIGSLFWDSFSHICLVKTKHLGLVGPICKIRVKL